MKQNNTSLESFINSLDEKEKELLNDYLDKKNYEQLSKNFDLIIEDKNEIKEHKN